MDFLSKFSAGIGAAVLIAITIALAALLGGTIIWLIWPFAFPVIFPKAVASGIILVKIPWWSAVCITWICSILLKSSVTTKKE